MASLSGAKGIPQKYFLKRIAAFSYNLGIWDLGIDWTTTVTDDSIQRPPDMFLESTKDGYILWQGPGPSAAPDRSTKVMEIKNERRENAKSICTECTGEKRTAQIYKVGKEGATGVPWWKTTRTLVDFEGAHYKWQSSFLGDITCTKEDGTVTAEFTRAKFFKFRDLGTMHIRVAMDKEMERLMIVACFIKWREDRH